MTRRLSVAEAKATLAECVRAVEFGETVLITRNGRTVAALVSAEDVEHLQRLRAAGPQGGLSSIAGGWLDSEELVAVLAASPRTGIRQADPA